VESRSWERAKFTGKGDDSRRAGFQGWRDDLPQPYQRNGIMRRPLTATLLGIVTSLLIASSALGHECINASKSYQAAGAQILIGPTGEIVWTTEGLANRIAQGVVEPDTGAGFHGLIAFDADGDDNADYSTWIEVGPDGEVPLVAQLNGPLCKGLTNLFIFFTECQGS
jgi:hypothetical protein